MICSMCMHTWRPMIIVLPFVYVIFSYMRYSSNKLTLINVLLFITFIYHVTLFFLKMLICRRDLQNITFVLEYKTFLYFNDMFT